MCDDTVHERKVAPVDNVVLDCGHERLPGNVGFSGHHQSCRVHVQTMHDAESIAFEWLDNVDKVSEMIINGKVKTF